MVRNDARRHALADAGIGLLARDGARGLTHRAVDSEAGVPAGTSSNYFPTRLALIAALIERIGQRLAPASARLEKLSAQAPSRELFRAYLGYIVERLSEQREVTLALFELRLEAARRPELAAPMADWLRTGFARDVAFNEAAGLPGDRADIALFHYAIDGALFDRLTIPIDPETPTDAITDAFAERLLP